MTSPTPDPDHVNGGHQKNEEREPEQVTTAPKLTPVFKMLIATILLSTLTGAIAGVGAWASFAAAREANAAAEAANVVSRDTNRIVSNNEAETSPEGIAARRQQIDEIIRSIEQRIDCKNELRLNELARSIEVLFELPHGAIFITPCEPTDSTTSTTQP